MVDESTFGERLARIEENVINISQGMMQMNEKLGKQYVRREEFEPVKKIVYGAVKIVLGVVLAALLVLVIIKSGGAS